MKLGKLFFWLLIFASRLAAAVWAPPAANQGAWLPGTDVGISGGIAQYIAGGVSDRAVTGNIINITSSPHFAATNDNVTTGTITSGQATLTVASATGFTAGNYIQFGLPAIHTLTITGGATSTQNFGFRLGVRGTDREISVAVVNGDTASQVAAKIRAASILAGAVTTSGTGADVIFTHTDMGPVNASSTQDAPYSGVTGTFAVTQAGTVYSHRIDSVAGNVLTLTANAAASVTNGLVKHDTAPSVDSAITSAATGDVIYFPAGTYRFGTGSLSLPLAKSNITFRGAGVGVTNFVVSTTADVFYTADVGYIATDIQTVTGTKTKGTSTLTVAANTNFTTANQFAYIGYENEVDTTRITNGAAPVWSSRGFPWSRTFTARVTGTTGTTISIDPPLVADATNLALRIHTEGYPTYIFSGWAFEDFSVTFDITDHTARFINLTTSQYGWFYNLHFSQWSKNSGAGSCIKLSETYRMQVQKCRFDALSFLNANGYETVNSDGAIETVANSSNLVIDNIFTGPWGFDMYDSGNSVNNVIAYNFSEAGTLPGFHNTHPSLNLIEGNAAPNHHSDGYHGSASHNTIYRNWYWSSYIGVILNRFKRNYAVAANVLGEDGVSYGGISFGNPNISNGVANGFAGPTGLSDQVGQTDYYQNADGPNTYVIQAGDVSSGDFWTDWEVTGTLTTRTSDTVGVFAMSGGSWVVGTVATAGGSLEPIGWYNSKASNTGLGSVTAVSGLNITITWPSGTLPAQGTSFQFYMSAAGWQERDLDVQPSSTLVENYYSDAGGTGSVQNGTADTLPDSLAYTSKPSWFGNLAWPAFDPNSPTFDETRIPAGYRYTNGNENYLTGGGTSYTPGRLRILRR